MDVLRAATNPEKVLVVERLEYDHSQPKSPDGKPSWVAAPGSVEYRIGYFIVSPLRRKSWWGQYAPLIPAEDFEALLSKARE